MSQKPSVTLLIELLALLGQISFSAWMILNETLSVWWKGEFEKPSSVGGWGACVHREKVQQEQCPGGPALQCPAGVGSHPEELQPGEDQTQLPGECTKMQSSSLKHWIKPGTGTNRAYFKITIYFVHFGPPQIFDFCLTDEEMKAIEALNKDIRFVELLM